MFQQRPQSAPYGQKSHVADRRISNWPVRAILAQFGLDMPGGTFENFVGEALRQAMQEPQRHINGAP